MQIHLLNNLKKPVYAVLALGVFVLMMDLAYYAMAKLPGARDNMCVIGAGFTTLNIFFSIVVSFAVAILVPGIIEGGKRRRAASVATSGVGALVGAMTVFCTACTLPVVSLFGFSFSLLFFTTYSDILKIVSLVLMLYGLYIVNKQLDGKCNICIK